MSVDHDLTLILDCDAPPSKMMLQFALAMSKESNQCLLCMISEFNRAVEDLTERGILEHGMDPDPLIEEMRPKEEDGFEPVQ